MFTSCLLSGKQLNALWASRFQNLKPNNPFSPIILNWLIRVENDS